MGRVGFKFPIFLTLIHYVTSWLLLAIFKTLSILPVAPPSRTTPFSSIFSLGAAMAFASGLANTSLKHNSVGFYQMAKIAVTPPTIVSAEFILFRKTISFNKIIIGSHGCAGFGSSCCLSRCGNSNRNRSGVQCVRCFNCNCMDSPK